MIDWNYIDCINCNVIAWNFLLNNSRFIDKILYKISRNLYKFFTCNKNNSNYVTTVKDWCSPTIGNQWCVIIKF